jgi:helix-turn-helix protein
VIRPRGALTRRRDDQEQNHSSAEEIGQLLRNAREERGLDLLAVHDRLHRPITQIEALEAGDLDRLPDRDEATSTLRRYGTFLGLDGEALATQLTGTWPAAPIDGTPSKGDETGVVPKSTRRRAEATATTRAVSVETSPDHLRAFTQTGEVPRFGVAPRAANGADPPTGTFPVVPRNDLRAGKRALARARRRMRAPGWLKVLTWTAVVCLFVLTAGWAVRTWNPQWLVQAHILRTAPPGGPPSTPAAAPSSPTTNHQAAAVQPVATGLTNASFVVRTAHFTVTIATTGRVWVQVVSSSSSVPLVVGVQPAGQVLRFKANGAMTVIVGASPVLVGVSIGGRNAYLNAPSVTPFTYTFSPPKST